MDPVFYDDPPAPISSLTFNTKNEIDRCMMADVDQAYSFHGVQPWMFGPINRQVKFSDKGEVPGGHVRAYNSQAGVHHLVYETERITVDENTWLPCFRKDRWFDSNAVQPELGNRVWSVDVPEVWEALSLAIELANRIMLALFKDQHTL